AGPVVVRVRGPLVSSPYVFMTVQMLRQWGLEGSYHLGGDCADFEGKAAFLGPARFGHASPNLCFHSPGGQGGEPAARSLRTYQIEPDASAASYFLAAAAVTGGRVTVH